MGLFKGLASLVTSALGGTAGSGHSGEELFDTPLSEAADAFLTACNTEFNAKQQRFVEQWLADGKEYYVDFARGLLRVGRESGPPVLFHAVLVGSHDRDSGIWEWAWNNPNAETSVALPKSALAGIGEEFNLKYLLSGFVPVPMEAFPLYLCGIALKATGGLGAHVATEGDMEYYLLVKDLAEGAV